MILVGLVPAISFFLWLPLVREAMARWNPAPSSTAAGHAPAAAEPGPVRWREAALATAVAWCAWLVLGTEGLSLFSAIRFVPVLIWWIVPIVAGAAVLWRMRAALGFHRHRLQRARWRNVPCIAISALVAFIMLWALAMAVCAPPNNYDALSYHMPREMRWMQRHNVGDFATNDLREIMMPPLSEYIGLHLMVLSGSDRLLALPQWAALALIVCAVSMMAADLGGDALAEFMAAALAVTIPMAFLQASNNKNDIITALWTCSAAYFTFRCVLEKNCPWHRAVLIGLSFGFMALTKGSGVLFALPIVLLATVAIIRANPGQALLKLPFIAVLTIAVNAGFFARNIHQFGTLIAPDSARKGGYGLINRPMGVESLTTNFFRDAAPDLATPERWLNHDAYKAIVKIHRFLGIPLNFPGFNFNGIPFRHIRWHPHNEDHASWPWQLLLLLLLPLALPMVRKHINMRLVLIFLALPVGGYLAFCLVLRWQPFHQRLLAPIPLLTVPALAVVYSARPLRPLWAAVIAIAAMTLAPSILFNSRPLVGPATVFNLPKYRIRAWMNLPYGKAGQDVAKYLYRMHAKTVGVFVGGNTPEYLFERPLLNYTHNRVRFITFNGAFQVPGGHEPDPPVVVSDRKRLLIHHHDTGSGYRPVAFFRRFGIYMFAQDAPPIPKSPPFWGWDKAYGLGGPEGPDPQWPGHRVRWGLFPETKLVFETKHGTPRFLLMHCWQNVPRQRIIITLNGQAVATRRFPAATGMRRLSFPLKPKPGINTLRISYARYFHEPFGRFLGLLYLRLDIK